MYVAEQIKKKAVNDIDQSWTCCMDSMTSNTNAYCILRLPADGILRCKPILTFHGHATKESKARRGERQQYSIEAHAYFNPTA